METVMTRPQPSSRRIAVHRCQSPLPIVICVLLALVVLAGCSTTTKMEQPQRPDAVHQAWIAAIRAGDTDAARALTNPDLPERDQFAREAVARMREYLTSPASPTGALEGVMVEPVADGAGRSVWQFAQKRWCYRAELIDRGGRWYISRWGQTSVDCR
jgi:uncharacterized protein YceK